MHGITATIYDKNLSRIPLLDHELDYCLGLLDTETEEERLIGAEAILFNCEDLERREKAIRVVEHLCGCLKDRQMFSLLTLHKILASMPAQDLLRNHKLRNFVYELSSHSLEPVRANGMVLIYGFALQGDERARSLLKDALYDPSLAVKTNACTFYQKLMASG